nr:esterase [Phaedon brassicae]
MCTLVKIPDGKLRGRKAITSRNIEFYAFQEIPYAMPPIGELRFEDPVPPKKWNGILNVTRNTKTCFQYINFLNVDNWRESQTEDCLYLNVYTPACPSSGGSLPVMFYIYGSGFLSGASDYDIFGPDLLMGNGVIVVTFNNRLGPLGFISTGDTVIPGNYGMKDQLQALKWVNRNIDYFGGDPNRVSIVGHSAGASAVGLHLLSKLSKGLYNTAVCQSGTSISAWTYQINYKRNAHRLAELLDSNFNKNASSEELLQFLRTVPAEEINSVVHNFPKTLLDEMDVQGYIFTPVVEPEHERAFLTENMYSAIKEGRVDRVPILIGITSEEGITRYDSDTPDLSERVEGWKNAARKLDEDPTNMVLDNMNIVDESEKKRVGETIRDLYPPGPFADNLTKTVKYFTDVPFTRAIIRFAELQSNYSDVYFYRFSYNSAVLNGKQPDFEGTYKVGHGDDNVFMWRFNGDDVVVKGSLMDILTSDRYRTLITNFIKYSNPTPNKLPLLNNIIWPKLQPDNFQFLDINETITIQNNLIDGTYRGWVKIYEDMARKPISTF